MCFKDKIDRFFALNDCRTLASHGNIRNDFFEYDVIDSPWCRTVFGKRLGEGFLVSWTVLHDEGAGKQETLVNTIDELVTWIRSWKITDDEIRFYHMKRDVEDVPDDDDDDIEDSDNEPVSCESDGDNDPEMKEWAHNAYLKNQIEGWPTHQWAVSGL